MTVLSYSFENGIVGENIGVGDVGEDEEGLAHVSVAGANPNELDGEEVWVDDGEGDWRGDELSLDLEGLRYCQVAGAFKQETRQSLVAMVVESHRGLPSSSRRTTSRISPHFIIFDIRKHSYNRQLSLLSFLIIYFNIIYFYFLSSSKFS